LILDIAGRVAPSTSFLHSNNRRGVQGSPVFCSTDDVGVDDVVIDERSAEMGVVVGNATGRGRGIVDISTLGDGFGCSTLRRPLVVSGDLKVWE